MGRESFSNNTLTPPPTRVRKRKEMRSIVAYPRAAAQRSPVALRPRAARRRPYFVRKRLARCAVDLDCGQVQTTRPISQKILREGTPQPAIERHKHQPKVVRQSQFLRPGPLPASIGAKAEKLLNPAAIGFDVVVGQPALPGHRLELFKHFMIQTDTILCSARLNRIFCFDKWPPSGQAGKGQRVLCCAGGQDAKRLSGGESDGPEGGCSGWL